MPFNFQLLVEFFFSGLITLVSILLPFGVIDPSKANELLDLFNSDSSSKLIFFVFIGGLISYYLGTVVNALSNKIIREFLSGYRIRMISRKLGLLVSEETTENDKESTDETNNEVTKEANFVKKFILILKKSKSRKQTRIKELTELEKNRKELLEKLVPTQVTELKKDQLKEIYTAARNYCGIYSEQTSKMVSYHWGLLRLSRATIFPLILFCAVIIIRLFIFGNLQGELFLLSIGSAALILTIISYRYREKFLIYTVFDIFFISQKIN